MIVIDREEYNSKAQELLNSSAYRSLQRDPTNKIKAQLITKLRKIKKESNLDEGTYRVMYPTGCVPLSFMDYPKYIKQATLLGPYCLAWVQLLMGLPRSLVKYSNP